MIIALAWLNFQPRVPIFTWRLIKNLSNNLLAGTRDYTTFLVVESEGKSVKTCWYDGTTSVTKG